MKKLVCIFALVLALFSNTANAQCIQPTLYASVTVPSAAPGTSVQVTTTNYSGEYENITFNVTGAFSFSSNISTDYLTLSDGTNHVLAFGFTPLAASIP